MTIRADIRSSKLYIMHYDYLSSVSGNTILMISSIKVNTRWALLFVSTARISCRWRGMTYFKR